MENKNLKVFKDNVLGDNYFCVDIETTGLDPLEPTASILEVYIKLMSKGRKIKEYYLKFWGDEKGWESTKHIHQIPREEIDFRPMFKESPQDIALIKSLFKRCYDPNDDLIFMAQYAPFEFHWFLEHLGLTFEERLAMRKIRTCDTRWIAKHLFPDEPHKLIYMCEKYGVGFPEGQHDFHRADQDVNAMWSLFEAMKKDIPADEIEDFNADTYAFDFERPHDDSGDLKNADKTMDPNANNSKDIGTEKTDQDTRPSHSFADQFSIAIKVPEEAKEKLESVFRDIDDKTTVLECLSSVYPLNKDQRDFIDASIESIRKTVDNAINTIVANNNKEDNKYICPICGKRHKNASYVEDCMNLHSRAINNIERVEDSSWTEEAPSFEFSFDKLTTVSEFFAYICRKVFSNGAIIFKDNSDNNNKIGQFTFGNGEDKNIAIGSMANFQENRKVVSERILNGVIHDITSRIDSFGNETFIISIYPSSSTKNYE